MEKGRGTFGSKFGVVMALAGSAVGLGNIWKFPYITGENGGGAFLIMYLFFIFLIGIPLTLTEMSIGRRGQRNVSGTFKKLAPGTKWHYFGILTIICSLLIFSFYGTIAGWTLEYLKSYVIHDFSGMNSSQIVESFNDFVNDPIRPVLWQVGFVILTGLVIIAGVKNGIERCAKFLMPILFVLVVILGIKACSLPGAKEGLKFLFYPDFSKLNGHSILIALGHCFFSLSTGAGVLLTYASYIDKKNDLVKTGMQVALADTGIAILAGLIIFPAVFAFGLEPNSGPGLIFLTIPQVFEQMSFGCFWGLLFFILITFAAITSTISFMEVLVAFVMEEWNFRRTIATSICVIVVSVLGVFSTLSFGPLKDVTLFGLTPYGIMDFLASNLLLPIGGFFMCFFAGWIMKKRDLHDELTSGGSVNFRFFDVYFFLIRYIVPLAIIIILLNGLDVFG